MGELLPRFGSCAPCFCRIFLQQMNEPSQFWPNAAHIGPARPGAGLTAAIFSPHLNALCKLRPIAAREGPLRAIDQCDPPLSR